MLSLEDRKLSELASDHRYRYYGKYRGIVKEVLTGDALGKLILTVPEVYHDRDSPPAWPCVPFAGSQHGLVALPEVGDGVWVEFEAGNQSRPIWTGFWWGAGEIPSPAAPKVRTWATSGNLKIVLDDDAGELRLEHPSGAGIKLSNDGLELSFNETTITIDEDGITMNDMVQVSLG